MYHAFGQTFTTEYSDHSIRLGASRA